jgi:hypothetical protein
MQKKMTSLKGVDASRLVATKYYTPLVLLAGCGAILFGGHPNFSTLVSRLILDAPFIFVAYFLLSVAEVRAAKDFFEYRRFAAWTKVTYDQIASCGRSCLPGFGYMRLIGSNGTKATIYFVSGPLFDQPGTELTAYIENQCPPRSRSDSHLTENFGAPDRNWQFTATMILAGLLSAIIAATLFPGFLFEPELKSFPSLLALLVVILWRASTWPWGMITLAILTLQVANWRFDRRVWSGAFVLGFVIGYMATQALNR